MHNGCKVYIHSHMPSNGLCFMVINVFSKTIFRGQVHGAKSNTPPKINTYERLPIVNTLQPPTVPHGVRVFWTHIVTILGVISGAASQHPHYFHVGYVTGWLKVGLGWLGNAYSSHSIHSAKGGRPTKHKMVISQDARALVPGIQAHVFN